MANNKKTQPEDDHGRRQAQAQLDSIIEMVDRLQAAIEAENNQEIEDAERAILEDPLSIEIRSDWHIPGQSSKGGQYNILLCTGGPACRIIGDLNEYHEPETARIEYQDWFTPWTNYPHDCEQEEKVLEYARRFYYAEE